jgi:hypothetical protein
MKKAMLLLITTFVATSTFADMNDRYGSMDEYIAQSPTLTRDLDPNRLDPAIYGDISSNGMFETQADENSYNEENLL